MQFFVCSLLFFKEVFKCFVSIAEKKLPIRQLCVPSVVLYKKLNRLLLKITVVFLGDYWDVVCPLLGSFFTSFGKKTSQKQPKLYVLEL